MDVADLVNEDNLFSAIITVPACDESVSTEYLVGGSAVFQIRSIPQYYDYDHDDTCHIISIRFTKNNSQSNGNNTLYLNSSLFNINNKVFREEDSWRIISTSNSTVFDISAKIENSIESYSSQINYSPHLLEDSDFTDFELKSNAGSVRVHRCLVALYSPVLKRMLQGSWKETKEGCLDLTDTSIETLKDFKQFIYLEKLPDNCENLMNLLLLAKHYMMSYLEGLCIQKLGRTVNEDSLVKLLEFSFVHQFPDLTYALLKYTNMLETNITKAFATYQESCKQQAEVITSDQAEVVTSDQAAEVVTSDKEIDYSSI